MFVRLVLLLSIAVFTQARVYDDIVVVRDQQILANKDTESRITNGQNSERGQFPYQIALYLDGRNFCGGSIIDKNWVLSAAHCVEGFQVFAVHMGAHEINNPGEPGRVILESRIAFRHENYNHVSLDNDVGLVKLPQPIETNDRISVIALPPRSFNQRDFTGQAVRVSGWGHTQDGNAPLAPILQFVNLKVISNDECKWTYPNTVTDKIVCASGEGGKSTCFGDSGCPLVIMGNGTTKTTHFAVVSFVSGAGCASGNPSGYDRTYKFLDWIHDKTGIPIQD